MLCFTYLSIPICLIGELHFGKWHGLLHPVCPKVGWLWVHVNRVGWWHFRLAAGHPFPVYVLPPVVIIYKHDAIHEACESSVVISTWGHLCNCALQTLKRKVDPLVVWGRGSDLTRGISLEACPDVMFIFLLPNLNAVSVGNSTESPCWGVSFMFMTWQSADIHPIWLMH